MWLVLPGLRSSSLYPRLLSLITVATMHLLNIQCLFQPKGFSIQFQLPTATLQTISKVGGAKQLFCYVHGLCKSPICIEHSSDSLFMLNYVWVFSWKDPKLRVTLLSSGGISMHIWWLILAIELGICLWLLARKPAFSLQGLGFLSIETG